VKKKVPDYTDLELWLEVFLTLYGYIIHGFKLQCALVVTVSFLPILINVMGNVKPLSDFMLRLAGRWAVETERQYEGHDFQHSSPYKPH